MNVYDAARNYVDKGYSVIPIRPNEKVPAQGWKRFQDQKPNAVDLQAFFAGQNRNLAIVTGPVSKLVVVDIDNPKLYDEYMTKWHTDMVAKTPSGGYHLYYEYDKDDIGNPIGRLQAEIDVRGYGGYVLAAPSSINGQAYEWVYNNKPALLPVALHDRIIELLQYSNPNTDIVHGEDGGDLYRRVLMNGFTPHKHNEEVKDIARYLTRRGMPYDDIVVTIGKMNAADKTPLPDYELIATINSGVGYEQKRLSAKQAAQAKSLVIPKRTDSIVPDVLAVAPKDDDILRVTDLRGFKEVVSNWDEQDWLIEGWIPEASIVMVASMPENYKTWLSFEAAVTLAYGGRVSPFFNQFSGPKQPVPVLIVQQEDELRSTAGRFDYIISGKVNDAVNTITGDVDAFGTEWTVSYVKDIEAPLYFHLDRGLSLDNDESLVALEEKIKTLGIKLVVIDPFYSLADADDYFASAARKIGKFKEMRDKYRVSFLLVHHTNKQAGNGVNGRRGIFGSNLLNGAMEAVWMVEKNDTTKERIIQRSGKAYPGKMLELAFSVDPEKDETTGALGYTSTVFKPSNGNNKVDGFMLEMLEYIQDEKGVTNADMYKYFNANDDADKGQIRTYAKRLLDKELIRKEGAGQNAKYYAVEEA